MDRLQSMRAFAKVVELGGFATAARAQGIAPAVMTRLISDLEHHLGARLLNRTTRRLALTETGERYLQRVKQILGEIEEAEAQVSAATTEPRGTLRLQCVPAFAIHQLARVLPRFRALYPQVNLDLTVGAITEQAEEAFDVTIMVVGEPFDSNVVARRIASVEVILCAAPRYLDRIGRLDQPLDLQQHACLLPNLSSLPASSARTVSVTHSDGRSTSVDVAPVLLTNQLDVLFVAAVAGMGISVQPSFVVSDALAEGYLERVLPEWTVARMGVYAALPTRQYIPQRTRVFLDFLQAAFRASAPHIDPWLKQAVPDLGDEYVI